MTSQDGESHRRPEHERDQNATWWSKPGNDPWAPPPALRPAAAPDADGPSAPAETGADGAADTPRPDPGPQDGSADPGQPATAGQDGWPPAAPAATNPWHVPDASRPPQARHSLATVVAVALAAGLTGSAATWFGARQLEDQLLFGGNVKLPVVSGGPTQRPAGTVAATAAAVMPSVVSIAVKSNRGEGTGSGFVIRTEGHILTNNHVVAAAASGGEIEVTFADGTTAAAKVVGEPDAKSDLAVIKVDGVRGLRAAVLGDSEAAVVGDPVLAIGSPLGLAGTVTSGIISSKNRPVTAGGGEGGGDESFINALQTDAAINPGNSGGPLVNARGEVIGVNSVIATLGGGESFGGRSQGGNIGLGFAIPVNQARSVAEQIINKGRAAHSRMGIALDTRYEGAGARIIDAAQVKPGQHAVDPEGPAAKAGLQPGDVIVQVDDRRITSSTELVVAISGREPGSKVKVTYRRGDATNTAEVTLAAAEVPKKS